jgi:hypothetical protein
MNGIANTPVIRNTAAEFEELRRSEDRVGNSRGLDQSLLCYFRAQVSTIRQPVRANDGEGNVMLDPGFDFSRE